MSVTMAELIVIVVAPILGIIALAISFNVGVDKIAKRGKMTPQEEKEFEIQSDY